MYQSDSIIPQTVEYTNKNLKGVNSSLDILSPSYDHSSCDAINQSRRKSFHRALYSGWRTALYDITLYLLSYDITMRDKRLKVTPALLCAHTCFEIWINLFCWKLFHRSASIAITVHNHYVHFLYKHAILLTISMSSAQYKHIHTKVKKCAWY